MRFGSLIPSRSSPAARSGGGDSDPFFSLRREMDRLFDDFTQFWDRPALGSTDGALAPRVDMAETEDGLEITAELPGVDPKDIELDLADDVLTLKAEHKSDREEKDDKRRYYLVERSRGTFMRRFALPFEPDQDKLEANFDKGVLRITIPRSATAEKRGRKIPVRAA